MQQTISERCLCFMGWIDQQGALRGRGRDCFKRKQSFVNAPRRFGFLSGARDCRNNRPCWQGSFCHLHRKICERVKQRLHAPSWENQGQIIAESSGKDRINELFENQSGTQHCSFNSAACVPGSGSCGLCHALRYLCLCFLIPALQSLQLVQAHSFSAAAFRL